MDFLTIVVGARSEVRDRDSVGARYSVNIGLDLWSAGDVQIGWVMASTRGHNSTRRSRERKNSKLEAGDGKQPGNLGPLSLHSLGAHLLFNLASCWVVWCLFLSRLLDFSHMLVFVCSRLCLFGPECQFVFCPVGGFFLVP